MKPKQKNVENDRNALIQKLFELLVEKFYEEFAEKSHPEFYIFKFNSQNFTKYHFSSLK